MSEIEGFSNPIRFETEGDETGLVLARLRRNATCLPNSGALQDKGETRPFFWPEPESGENIVEMQQFNHVHTECDLDLGWLISSPLSARSPDGGARLIVRMNAAGESLERAFFFPTVVDEGSDRVKLLRALQLVLQSMQLIIFSEQPNAQSDALVLSMNRDDRGCYTPLEDLLRAYKRLGLGD